MENAPDRARLAALLARRETPLTPNQQSLWAWEQLEPGHPALTLSSEWDLESDGEGLGPRLRQAFEALVQRHQNLRTVFPLRQGQPVPSPWDGELDFQEFDASRRELPELLQALEREPFDLANQPPFRVRLITGAQCKMSFQLHHVACDWWSMLLLVEELGALLRGESLPPLALDFATYARWQQAWLEGPEAEQALAHWQRELAAPRRDFRFLGPPGEPPAEHPRSTLPVPLSASLERRLRALAQQQRLSMTALLLACFGQALALVTGRDDPTVAVPCHGRWRSAFRHLVGPLYSILPLRLATQSQGEDWWREVDRSLQRGLERQELPFPVLVERLRPRRLPGAFPFTSAGFSLLPYHPQWTAWQAPGLRGRHVSREFWVGPFEVTLNGLDGERLDLKLQIQEGGWSSSQASRLVETLVEVLQARSEGSRVRFPLRLSEQRLEQRWGAIVERSGPLPAVRQGERCWSYREIDTWARRWTQRLIQATPSEDPGTPVGLIAEPSVESVVGWLAIWLAGRTVMPLAPSVPPARWRQVVADSGCRIVLSTVPGWEGVQTLDLQEDPEAPPWLGGPPVEAEAAYLITTSGSQGQPRGVLGSHLGLLHRVEAMERSFPFRSQERCLLRTPLVFVDAVAEWFAPLHGGATLVPWSEPGPFDARRWLDFLQRQQIARATLVPSLLGALLRQGSGWPVTLRLCLASGEVLRPDLVREFYRQAAPGSVLLNLYGSTECAGDVTWFDTRELEPGAPAVPLGWPLGQSRVRVVDPQGQEVEEGQEGEIWVAGPGLALGYHGDPEQTAETFPHHGGERWLRTGDHGLWSKGALEFQGRRDRRHKVRGWRVELQEVEAVLEAVPGVQEAVVETTDSEGLQAWLGGDRESAEPHLRRLLESRLPAALRPAPIWIQARLPRTESGKIDRLRLRHQPGQRLGGSEPPALGSPDQSPALGPADQSPAWRPLAALWERVLGCPSVGPHDNFFELGGHSLSAVEVCHHLSRDWGRVIPPAVLVERPTVALLWEALSIWQRPPVLVEMRAGDQGVPLVLLPGAWGGAIGFQKLVHRLAGSYPIVALEFEALEAADRQDLESVAEAFVRELRRWRPQGPYRLCGYSMGGLLAYEMARRLADEVERLVLLDAVGPLLVPAQGPAWRHRFAEAWTHVQILARSKPQDLLDRLRKRAARRAPPPSEQLALALDYVASPRVRAPLERPATLLRLSYQPEWVDDPLLGWSELLPQLQVRTVLGLHGPLVLEEPIVGEVALALQQIGEDQPSH